MSLYQQTHLHLPEEPPKGIDRAVDTLWGVVMRRRQLLAGLLEEAGLVVEMESAWQELKDKALRSRLMEHREKFRRSRHPARSELLGALAGLREMAFRSSGLKPFPVQIAGALALHDGYMAEMETGEGKTLTSSLAATLAGWTGRPCHIITVNDYLARRDANWFKEFYKKCGVSVGFVIGESEPDARREAYRRDVTYTTSKEVTADFLRDRILLGPVSDATRLQLRSLLHRGYRPGERLVQRGIHTAIIDEADSVLIDEAVTPLLISQQKPNPDLVVGSMIACEIANGLKVERDYTVDARYREINLNPCAVEIIEKYTGPLPAIWRSADRREELVKQALSAREFFRQGEQYIRHKEKVVIIDEATGRMMPNRTWREGLHQAVEAKENMAVSDPSETLARISFQRYFRLYRKLSGMTGTGMESAREFWQVYRLPVITIPRNKPCLRITYPERVFPDADAKWDAVVEEVARLHQENRPVLIGTRSVTASERLAESLRRAHLPFQLLNATRHEQEASIIAEAGQPGRITIATNMAGRGTDIRLGSGVADNGGLHAIMTERHDSARVDRQLQGRSGRQGDPGSVQSFVSLDDDLLLRYISTRRRAAYAKKISESRGGDCGLFDQAQKKAQSHAFKQRLAVLRKDNWLEESLAFSSSETNLY